MKPPISSMQVICIESEAFYELIDAVIDRIAIKEIKQDKWITDQAVMNMLNITSKTTLQKLRNEGVIRFSQPKKKIILYDRDSILHYLEKNAVNLL